MLENFLEFSRYFALTSYCNSIGQSNNAFSTLGLFLEGKTKSACFDLFIHWLIKQITNTFSYENRSDTLEILAFEAPSTQIQKFLKPRIIVGGFFNHFGERFQKDAVLVRGFTGFVWTERRFVKRKMRIRVDVAWNSAIFCWFKWRRKHMRGTTCGSGKSRWIHALWSSHFFHIQTSQHPYNLL